MASAAPKVRLTRSNKAQQAARRTFPNAAMPISPGSVGELAESPNDVRALALQVWKNRRDADRWLKEPHMLLGGASPESLLATAKGTHVVLNLLGALEHGFPV